MFWRQETIRTVHPRVSGWRLGAGQTRTSKTYSRTQTFQDIPCGVTCSTAGQAASATPHRGLTAPQDDGPAGAGMSTHQLQRASLPLLFRQPFREQFSRTLGPIEVFRIALMPLDVQAVQLLDLEVFQALLVGLAD